MRLLCAVFCLLQVCLSMGQTVCSDPGNSYLCMTDFEFAGDPTTPVRQTFHLNIPQDIENVAIELEAWMAPGNQGNVFNAMELEFNFQNLDPVYMEGGTPKSRLMNKPLEFITRARGAQFWSWGNGWHLYALDCDLNCDPTQISTAGANTAYWPAENHIVPVMHQYLIDVSDLAWDGARNSVTIINPNPELIRVKSLKVRPFDPNTEHQFPTPPYAAPVADGYLGANDTVTNYQYQVNTAGDLEITSTNDPAPWTSSIDYVPTPLPTASKQAFPQAGPLQLTRVDHTKNQTVVSAKNSMLLLNRTYDFQPGRIRVRDVVQNMHGSDLHLNVDHQIHAYTGAVIDGIRLGGQKSAPITGAHWNSSTNAQLPHNPSFYMEATNSAMGLVPIDDVGRAMASVFFDATGDGFGGVRAHNVLLTPTIPLVFEWDIYPRDAKGYLPFVNKVRNDWGLNYRIDGRILVFETPALPTTAEALRELIEIHGIEQVVIAAVLDDATNFPVHGKAFVDEFLTYQQRLIDARELVREADPNVKLLYYFCPFLKLANSGAPDILKRADGSEITFAGSATGPQRAIFYTRFDETNTAFIQDMETYLNNVLETLEYDGIFWDLFPGGSTHRGYGGLPYHGQDNPMTTLAENGFTEMALAATPVTIHLLERIYNHHKAFAITNGGAVNHAVMETLKRYKVLNIHESNEPHRLGNGYFSSPVHLRIIERKRADAVANSRHVLRHGSLYSSYVKIKEATDRPFASRTAVYPIEPLELHHGYIIGRNKIVTTRPGAFGFNQYETQHLRVRYFDEHDDEVPVNASPRFENGRILVDVDIPYGWLAVIERDRGIANWRLDETSGAIAADASGNGWYGTLMGGATFSSQNPGRLGYALTLNGVNQYIQLADQAALKPQAFTVAAWVKPAAGVSPLFSWGDEAGLYLDQDGYMRIRLADNNYRSFVKPAKLTDGAMHHVIFTCDTSLGAFSGSLYVDGALAPLRPDSKNQDAFSNAPPVMGVPRIGRFGTDYYQGDLDDVRLFAEAMSEVEAKALYAATTTVGHWSLDQAGGQDALDVGLLETDGALSTGLDFTDPPTPGMVAGALAFDNSVGDYVQVPHQVLLNPQTPAFTLSAWIKPNTLDPNESQNPNGDTLFSKGDWNGANHYYLGFKGNTLRFALGRNWGQALQVPADEFTAGAWHHVTATVNENGHKLFVNGEEKASDPFFSSSPVNTSQNLALGSLYTNLTSYFDGLMDDARVSMVSQSDQDVEAAFFQDVTVGYWRLDDAKGAVVMDQSAARNHGKRINGPANPYTIPESTPLITHLGHDSGIHGTAFFLDEAAGEHVVIPHHDSLNPKGNQFTIAAWVRANALNTTADFGEAIVSKGSWSGNNHYYLGFYADDLIFAAGVSWNNGLRIPLNSLPDGEFPVQEWHELVAVADGGELRLYLDGEVIGTHSPVGMNLQPSTKDLLIGAISTSNGPAAIFNGAIDHVRIYQTALSPEQIREHYQASAPMAWWSLDETTGSAFVDQTDHGFDGRVATHDLSTITVPGIVGNALYMADPPPSNPNDNVNVEIPHRTDLNPSGKNFTVSAYVNLDSLPANGEIATILIKGDPNNVWNYYLRFVGGATGAELHFSVGEGSSGTLTLPVTPAEFPPGTWVHVAGVNAADFRGIYIDGVLMASDDQVQGTVTPIITTGPLWLGHRNKGDYLNGALDEVRLFNKDLNQTEIGELIAPVGHWTLDETSGTVIHDETANQNHGAPAGGLDIATDTIPGAYKDGYPQPVSGCVASALAFRDPNPTNPAATEQTRIVIPHNDALNPKSALGMAISVWIKPESLPVSGDNSFGNTVINKGDWGQPNQYYLGFYQNQLRFVAGQNWGAHAAQIPQTHFNTNRWYHIVGSLTINADNSADLQIYVDGATQSSWQSHIDAANFTWPITNINDLFIGSINGGGTSYFDGGIDDLWIYDRPLGSAEVERLYNRDDTCQ